MNRDIASSTDESAVTRKTRATRTATPKQAPYPEAVVPPLATRTQELLRIIEAYARDDKLTAELVTRRTGA